MTDFNRFIKLDEILENIQPRVQAVSHKVCIGAF